MPIQGKTGPFLRISSHPRQPSVWFYPPYLSAKHLPTKARHPGKLWMLHLWQNHAHGPGHSDRVLNRAPLNTLPSLLEAPTQTALDKSFQVTTLSGGGLFHPLLTYYLLLRSHPWVSGNSTETPHPAPPLALNCQQTPGL